MDLGLNSFTITLNSGLQISMTHFEQHLFQARSLEGFPIERAIRRRRERYMEKKRRESHAPILFIEPPMLPFELPKMCAKVRALKPCRFPNVLCCAHFVETNHQHRRAAYISWFQEHFGTELPESVLEQIQSMDWLSQSYEQHP